MIGGAVARIEKDSFSYAIMNAADRANDFLGVVRDRCNASGIGLSMAPATTKWNGGDIVMRADLKYGNAWKGVVQYQLDVYATPQGPVLNVGWQLTTMDMKFSFYGGSSMDMAHQMQRARIEGDPNTIRDLDSKLQAFQMAVFLPTVQQLAQAVGGLPQQPGFMGA